jgi:hypothetical protein
MMTQHDKQQQHGFFLLMASAPEHNSVRVPCENSFKGGFGLFQFCYSKRGGFGAMPAASLRRRQEEQRG